MIIIDEIGNIIVILIFIVCVFYKEWRNGVKKKCLYVWLIMNRIGVGEKR